ncbi:HpcH/HpaI aldolase family protein [Arthrobacter sp. VKM Ac-2550]|uniref:HpcH/HpaI aldolase family protein n=1 Tax=Crystallibacter permensis TaxID=1938888 RepID=UPI002226A361|nr:aldolase/citrate lyase family protein [Arthrobacter sp. VKM Ac-2550]MCW2130900.1 4-hydroxy-2-oxoheptanedioate aldolase [Arthrobacter sp. VKM Ac-2550]
MNHPAADVIAQAKQGKVTVGYWSVLDSPISNERVAMTGYDYIALDGQHGLMGYSGILANLMAIDAAHGPAGIVRVEANNAAVIGQALDAGARGVIVPLVNNSAEAEAAVQATRYPGTGMRSYGPMRSGLRVGPTPADSDGSVILLVMIETAEGLDNVESICAVEGVDGVYIGPSDLSLAVGGKRPNDPDVAEDFNAAVKRVLAAAKAAGRIAAIHTPSGAVARQRIEQGFTFVSIASDLTHLEQAARDHLAAVR